MTHHMYEVYSSKTNDVLFLASSVKDCMETLRSLGGDVVRLRSKHYRRFPNWMGDKGALDESAHYIDYWTKKIY